MKDHFFKKNSILYKVFFPMMFVIILQLTVFIASIMWHGLIDHLNENSFEILNERVSNRKSQIENEMSYKWSNLDASIMELEQLLLTQIQSKNITTPEFLSNPDEVKDYLSSTSLPLINLLRRSNVNGVFLIMNQENGYDPETQMPPETCMGLCIRDLDQTSGFKDNEDLLIERGPISVVKHLGIPYDAQWESDFVFVENQYNDYFVRPLQAAYDHPGMSSAELGYWGAPYKLSQDDLNVITYSLPLMDENGFPYGVLGVELTSQYMSQLLRIEELSHNNSGVYLIGSTTSEINDEKTFNTYIVNGRNFRSFFNNTENLAFESKELSPNTYFVNRDNTNNLEIYGNIQYFNLYNNDSPYRDEKLALIALVDKEVLLSFSENMKHTLILVVFISFLVGLIGIFVVSNMFAKPIKALSDKVRRTDLQGNLTLEKTNIFEIDQLIESIVSLSHDIVENEAKLSSIIQMTEMQISAFEVDTKTRKVFFSENFFEIMSPEITVSERNSMYDADAFKAKLLTFKNNIYILEDASNSTVYRFSNDNNEERWIRFKTKTHQDKLLGIVMDVTSEIQEKLKIERERDQDVLTGLNNRRAFHSKLEQLFSAPEMLGVAAMLMMDLDNLKYINDTFGHDIGDEYIKYAALTLKEFENGHTLISRISGDEFMMFIYGYESSDDVYKIVLKIKELLSHSHMALPGISSFRIRLSGGIAWYPKDSEDYHELIRYADFAMYQVKRTDKGDFQHFSLESYNRDSYLLQHKEELNRLIEDELVEYFFQAIVDIRTGEIFAYEALMRPYDTTIKTPLEVLNLARSQGQLHHIEKLTWQHALKAFSKHEANLSKDCKLFINSIPNQRLNTADLNTLHEKYGELFNKVVLELTEDERIDNSFFRSKFEGIKRIGGQLAIDDYGSGYNSNSILVDFLPSYVKVDMGIIRNIDKDINRQGMLRTLISYTKERDIKVIAEGVETQEELLFVMAEGVDYAQGYLLSMPAPKPFPLSKDAISTFEKCLEKLHPHKDL